VKDIGGTLSCLVAFVIAVAFFVTLTRKGQGAHRRHNHAHASIIWRTGRNGCPAANEIIVDNIDDVDAAELGHYVHYSSMRTFQHLGRGRWKWTFSYMGDKRATVGESEDLYGEPYHISHMKGAAEAINMFLEDHINPAKDRDAERSTK
jgi:hypothetical protein